MINKFIKNNKGFSLIELLVSIVLLTLIAVAFLPLFTNTFSGIIFAGDRNDAINTAQMGAEMLFNSGIGYKDNIAIDLGVELITGESELNIVFGSGGNSIAFNVPGDNATIKRSYKGNNEIELDIFVPK